MKSDYVCCLNVRLVCLVVNLLPNVVIVGAKNLSFLTWWWFKGNEINPRLQLLEMPVLKECW